MARISFLFFFCILAVTAGAQKFAVSNPAQNFFYNELSNPLQVVVNGYPCQSVFLSADNGRIEGTPCHYTYLPARVGVAKITVWQWSNHKKKKIGETLFRVRPIPDPRPTIG
ncbi:MAG TPA: hypothetical protein VLD19_10285, partial [Chitinophagaceae bacterium]|nr:hypothetical protein [Chitinophagaceae bacterium]